MLGLISHLDEIEGECKGQEASGVDTEEQQEDFDHVDGHVDVDSDLGKPTQQKGHVNPSHEDGEGSQMVGVWNAREQGT